MKDQDYFNAVAGVLAIAVLATVIALPMAFPTTGSTATATSSSGQTSYVNLTIALNATTGWPQYSPANFSVPQGRVVFTITDHDSVANWTGCECAVQGTVNGVETINGTPYSTVPSSNVAHTFSIPALGLNVLSPGLSLVSFTIDVTQAGTYSWFCMDPCGTDPGGYSGGPMSTPGYMSGTMTVS
ncbi:MAG TPA: hypothetical protein VKT21_01685 [Thermoplasmata archaeon]|nr:hypothetical protein [Thermoplasmata archaeon]